MGIVKPKRKIGGIEEIFGPEVFFGLLGWTDRKFHNDVVRLRISEEQNYVLERLGTGIHKGSITNVARAILGLGVLIDTVQKARNPAIIRGITKAIRYNSGNHTEKIAEKMIDELNLTSSKVQEDLKNMIEAHGDNKLGEYIWSMVQPSCPYDWEINHQPKFRDIKRRVHNIKWGLIPLDDEKRFKLHRSPENVLLGFRCTERLVILLDEMNREFYHFPQAKIARGVFVKGMYVLAKWYQDNNEVVADWYNMTSLLNQLHLLKCKDYR